MIKYVVFDVDRTLVDSFQPELLSFQDAMESVVGYRLNKEQVKDFTSFPTNVFLERLNISNEQIEIILKKWEITFKEYKTLCFKGIKEAIRELRNKGLELALITSRTMEEYHELDGELSDISNCFIEIVTSNKVVNPKPNAESMEYLCNKLRCNSEEVIYIGDNFVDKEFAINCKCHFIPACYENKELSSEENACFDPKELPNIVEKIINAETK